MLGKVRLTTCFFRIFIRCTSLYNLRHKDLHPDVFTHQNLITMHLKTIGVQRPMYKIELWLRSANADTAEILRVRMLDALSDGETSKENTRVKMPDFDFKKRS